MKKILVVCPHLSTGGSGQVTANKIKLLQSEFEIRVVEYAFLAWQFVVQRNRIIELVGKDNFYSLGENKFDELITIIEIFKPDCILMEEFPEMFCEYGICQYLYRNDKPYTIIETTHDSSFNPKNKVWMPNKFVFVSPYSALKYNHLDIPYEIIEYPVDLKECVESSKAKHILGLELDYKHVVIIGLFTQRKNQGYAFEIARNLLDHKIKFHFLGNQAGNFQDYWQPLMNNKPDNCIIWGERSDTNTFIEASDLFLFPSKGDRGNKELNPIVIKESLECQHLPKLIFNLDVYLNRYDNYHNVFYLTGDINQDTNKVLELTNAKQKINQDELIIIGTYPNLKSRVQLTKDTINSLKPLGKKIMLVSHYPVDLETQNMVDYYIYDAENPLTYHSYYTKFYNYQNDYEAEININGLKDSNQSLTVLTNIFNGAKAAKDLGYKRFFYSTYDVVVHEKDLQVIEESFDLVNEYETAYLASLNTPFGKGIQTNGMTFNTDFFLKEFHDVRHQNEYNNICNEIGCQNFLEDYFIKVINRYRTDINKSDVTIINNQEETFLTHSGLGVASNSEYYSILPIAGKKNKYMFYFFTYNIDSRVIWVNIDNYSLKIDIEKTKEFKYEFEYTGNNVIEMLFHDGNTIYKMERFEMNPSTIQKYQNTGKFTWKNQKPKIKLVHIQTTIQDEREQKSKESIKQVEKYGIEYIQHINEPYNDIPPKHNCQRPSCVSMDLFDEATIQIHGTALTPAHYGCYEAFKNAILSEFYDCDFLIVCEGDCLLEVNAIDFTNKVYQVSRLCNENNIGYFSFGDTKTLEHGWLQSPVIETIPNQDLLFITNHIIGLQCIMFPKFTSDWLKHQLRTQKWDASDMLFNIIFQNSNYKMGILHNRITTQIEGYSLIDKQEKQFL